jgi:hypothetical protein
MHTIIASVSRWARDARRKTWIRYSSSLQERIWGHLASSSTDTNESLHLASLSIDTNENLHLASPPTDTNESLHLASLPTDTNESLHLASLPIATTESLHLEQRQMESEIGYWSQYKNVKSLTYAFLIFHSAAFSSYLYLSVQSFGRSITQTYSHTTERSADDLFQASGSVMN